MACNDNASDTSPPPCGFALQAGDEPRHPFGHARVLLYSALRRLFLRNALVQLNLDDSKKTNKAAAAAAAATSRHEQSGSSSTALSFKQHE